MSLRVMVVDDEALARQRLRTLLGDCRQPEAHWVGEAAHAPQAVALLAHTPVDVVLLDIHMPGADGLALAQTLSAMAHPPALVFVTAHAEHAVQAFELDAVDYLTKPVRLERLAQALRKAQLTLQATRPLAPDAPQPFVLIHDRGRSERVPLHDIVYLKAELKYVTVRTRDRSLIYDGSLSEFEERHGAHWLRIHRNALVARHAVRALQKHHDSEEGEGWAVRLVGVDEPLAVSRRQLAGVREVLGKG